MAEDVGVTEIMAFATSAIREAANGEEVIAEVAARTGVTLEVPSGDEEARLTFWRCVAGSAGAAVAFCPRHRRRFPELAIGADEDPDVAVSVPPGCRTTNP